MCVPRNEDVDIQLPLQQPQTSHVAPRDHLVAVDETDLKLANCDNLLLWVIQVLGTCEKDKQCYSLKNTPASYLLLETAMCAGLNRHNKQRNQLCFTVE